MRSKSTRRPQFTRPLRLIIGLLIISSAIVWLLVGRSPFTATAFKPVGEARATDFDKTHTQMTDEAIRELITGENIIPGVTKISKTMREAIKLIKRGNSNSDLQLYGMYLDDEAHFTGETFAGSQARIYSQFLLIKTALRANDLYNARKALGQTFHAIQDFYTHSNWIEKGNTGINPNVGDFSRTGALLASAALPFETTCDNCEIENCQDCVGNVITPSLTTAYFQALPLTGFKPLGKCSHGGTHWDLSQDFPATGGINKDTLDCEVSPHNYHHLQAAALAKEHTKRVSPVPQEESEAG